MFALNGFAFSNTGKKEKRETGRKKQSWLLEINQYLFLLNKQYSRDFAKAASNIVIALNLETPNMPSVE